MVADLVNPAFMYLLVFAVATVVYSLNVHIMANLILLHGSSREKSMKTGLMLSIIFSSFLAAAWFLQGLIQPGQPLQRIIILGGIGVSYVLYVIIGQVAYTRKVYDTTTLFALLIAHGLVIFVKAGIFLLARPLLGAV